MEPDKQRHHFEQRGVLQAPVAAAAHQLHGLHDEFDFANSARSQLQVVLEVAARHFARDQRLHLAQRLEHSEIEIPAVDEGPHEFLVCAGVGFVAHHGARLDPGIPLPIAAVLLQIIIERRQAHDQRSAFAEGAQAHVHAKYEAILGSRIEQPDEFPAEPVEILLVVDRARAVGLPGLREQEHEIDVGREIELPAAEFAHAEHDQRHLRAVRAARPAERSLQLRLCGHRGGANAGVREFGQAAQGFGDARAAGDLAPGDAQHFAPPPLAQHPLRFRAACCVGGTPLVLAVCLVRVRRHRVAAQPRERLGIAVQRRGGELAARNHPRQLISEALGQRRIGRAPCILPGGALPPSQHGFAQGVGQRVQSWNGSDH